MSMVGLVFAIEGIPRTTCFSERLIFLMYTLPLVVWMSGSVVEVLVGCSAVV